MDILAAVPVLQLLQGASDVAHNPGDGSWHRESRLEGRRARGVARAEVDFGRSYEDSLNIISIVMTRILWIVGLSTALFIFGGWTILIVYAGISHRHLNSKGIVMLVCDGYVAWITFQYPATEDKRTQTFCD